MGHVLMGLQAGSMNSTGGCGIQKLYQVILLAVLHEDKAGMAGKAGKEARRARRARRAGRQK
jgi:hypothetical protein